jgi:transglutaminase-like putative cysteine protease
MLLDAPDNAGHRMLLEQEFHYTYERPIRNLRHRLVTVPRERHGAQARESWDLTVVGASANRRELRDAFGNHVIEIEANEVVSELTFTISAVVSWNFVPQEQPSHLDEGTDVAVLASPTVLTDANRKLAEVAAELASRSTSYADFGDRVCAWSADALTYEYGVTGVRTPATAALEAGRGVCQDFSHIMLAICRAAAVPARYVSGHLVGEGGSHAWVEILADKQWIAFDPTHGRRTDQRYLTVAVGREYRDVAPTSGTFSGKGPSVLSSTKRLSILPAPE